MKNYFILILIIILSSIIGVIIGINYYTNILIVDIKEVTSTIVVMDGIGIDTNKTALTFGGVNPGGTSSRDLYIIQELKEKTKVKINMYGEFSDWVTISDNNFFLYKNETKVVKFIVKVPSTAEKKKYEGKAVIIFQKTLI